MIRSFRSKDTEALFNGEEPRQFRGIAAIARRKLDMLDYAAQPMDLRVPRNNRLEALKGERKGQFSIRINDQWRICFTWRNGNAYDVEIVDYH